MSRVSHRSACFVMSRRPAFVARPVLVALAAACFAWAVPASGEDALDALDGDAIGPDAAPTTAFRPAIEADVAADPGVTLDPDTGSPAPQYTSEEPEATRGLDVDEQLGRVLPLDLVFRDSRGDLVRLADYFFDDKPVILNLGYYRCPMLCSLVLSGLEDAVDELDWDLGEQYEIVTISIDHRETPALAREHKADTAARLLGRDVENGWHFLTGEGRPIEALADATGFGYRYLEGNGQFVHAAVLMVVSPEGKIARYHYGIDFPEKDIKFSLFTASEGRTAGTLDRIIMSCFVYDAALGKYTPNIMMLMKVAGVMTILGIAVMVGVFALIRAWRMKRRELATERSAAENRPATA